MSIENQKKNNSELKTLKEELLNVYEKITTLYEIYSKMNTPNEEWKEYQEFLKEFDIGQSFQIVNDIATKILKMRRDNEIEIKRRMLYLRRKGVECSQKSLNLHNLIVERDDLLFGQYDWEERERLERLYNSKIFPLEHELHNSTIDFTGAILEFCDYLFDVLT